MTFFLCFSRRKQIGGSYQIRRILSSFVRRDGLCPMRTIPDVFTLVPEARCLKIKNEQMTTSMLSISQNSQKNPIINLYLGTDMRCNVCCVTARADMIVLLRDPSRWQPHKNAIFIVFPKLRRQKFKFDSSLNK